MKRFLLSVCLVWSATLLFAQNEPSAFMKKLTALKDVSGVERLETKMFPEKYLIWVRQNVDGDNADKGTFNQRVIVGYRGEDRPTVIVTEGYYADYALSPYYMEELCQLFNANMVFCEYRYFGPSTPEPCDWTYMTVRNSLRDLHHVNQTLRSVFKGKWISTGISKGGQTTMFYRAYYPEDMDVSVSYVAPLNKKVEDGRHEKFLSKKVGTKEERKEVLDAQEHLMERKPYILPKWEEYCKEKGYSFRVPMADIYDFCVMEYSFALWQWGTPVSSIPDDDASDETWLKHFIEVSSPDYFSLPNRYMPFFVQAAKELGYYGYDNKPFRKLCSVKHPKHYLRDVMLTEELSHLKFDRSLYKYTKRYLKKNDPKHIFIYGEIDPWSSSGVAGWLDCSRKQNMRVYVQPRGSHTARIGNMPENMRHEIIDRLIQWVDE